MNLVVCLRDHLLKDGLFYTSNNCNLVDKLLPMKLVMKISVSLITSILFIFCTSDKNKVQAQNQKLNFNDYWYQGKAEITSYTLKQSRYGEIYEGTAVNIYVTEDFLPEKQVKADAKSKSTIPVLKLNSIKKFVTGIYPYSLMTSTFSPINSNKETIKISFSSQEWCGNTFMQLNNREKFEIDFHSYFENNSDRQLGLKKDILENELWNRLRLNPKKHCNWSHENYSVFRISGFKS